MYIRNRFDKDGNIITDPSTLSHKSEELLEFLAEIYFKDTAVSTKEFT